MYVKCGKCPSCQMEKANARLRRIKNSLEPSTVSLFVTLTYAPKYLPYIKPQELRANMAELNVYRDYDKIKVRKSDNYEFAYKDYKRTKPLKTFDCLLEKLYYNGVRLPRARGSRNKIGVLYYKDLQDFCKRLERNLYRHYGITGDCYKMFKVSELGETYFRPHFHLLIHIPPKYVDQFYFAIRSSWPFDSQGLERQIEFAKNASSYISRYVCRGSDFPKFFENKCFKPKCSFSKGFGLVNSQFSLSNLIASVDRGSCTYNTGILINGQNTPVDLFYPKYFIDRYFPRFKGYSRLSYDQLFKLLQCPRLIYQYGKYLGYVITPERNDYECFLRTVRLRYGRFCASCPISGRNIDLKRLFAYYYYKVWVVYRSNSYKMMFNDVRNYRDLLQCYDNVAEAKENMVLTDLDLQSESVSDYITHPNLFERNIVRTDRLENDYFSHLKRKKVTNSAYRAEGMKI